MKKDTGGEGYQDHLRMTRKEKWIMAGCIAGVILTIIGASFLLSWVARFLLKWAIYIGM